MECSFGKALIVLVADWTIVMKVKRKLIDKESVRWLNDQYWRDQLTGNPVVKKIEGVDARILHSFANSETRIRLIIHSAQKKNKRDDKSMMKRDRERNRPRDVLRLAEGYHHTHTTTTS